MTRKFWDTWGVAILAGLLTGVPLAVGSAYFSAYITDTPIKHPLSFGWIVAEMHRSVPMWFAIAVVFFAALMTTLYAHERAAKKIALAEGLEETTEPALPVAYWEQQAPLSNKSKLSLRR